MRVAWVVLLVTLASADCGKFRSGFLFSQSSEEKNLRLISNYVWQGLADVIWSGGSAKVIAVPSDKQRKYVNRLARNPWMEGKKAAKSTSSASDRRVLLATIQHLRGKLNWVSSWSLNLEFWQEENAAFHYSIRSLDPWWRNLSSLGILAILWCRGEAAAQLRATHSSCKDWSRCSRNGEATSVHP